MSNLTNRFEEHVGSAVERNAVLWLTNISHAVNHFQNQMVAVLYVVIMPELGFGYAELGVVTAVMSLMGGMTQGLYGFATPFVPRAWLLGIGNIVLGLGTLAQHPVGSSLLVGYFPRTRGTILALNTSISNVGSLLSPLAAGAMLLIMDWRNIFMIVATLSLAMGATYFLFRNRLGNSIDEPRSGRAKLAQGRDSYKRVIRNKNMILVSLVMMVGGAGRDMGVNLAYLGPHFKNDLALSTTLIAVALTAMNVGGIIGPIFLGWLSDKGSRKWVIQFSLVLSALATLWLAFQGAYLPFLMLNLLLYGVVTRSRMTLTQAMVSDSLPEPDRDAAFSVFFFLGFASAPFWALLVGLLMEHIGFTFAFSVLAGSYLLGIVLMFFVEDARPIEEGLAT